MVLFMGLIIVISVDIGLRTIILVSRGVKIMDYMVM
jgi:hypothetical protein